MEKEYWKDEVMNSLHGIRRAEPNPFLFTRIEERVKSPSSFLSDRIIPLPKLSFAFAGIVLLFVLNVLILKNSVKEMGVNEKHSPQSYSMNNINYQLY